MRTVLHRYEDPLDRIWLSCAERVGLKVVRVPGAFASTDGRGNLFIATPEELDKDDCLAQMIFHELVHALAEGPESFELEDWGLNNTNDQDEAREHACLRTQAFLLRPYGLGRTFGPTTDFRLFYDALGPDPLLGDAKSVQLAKKAILRVRTKPWAPHLEEALEATAALMQLLRNTAPPSDSLWSTIEGPRGRHALGFGMPHADERAASESCGSCGFAKKEGKRLRCLKTDRTATPEMPACQRWEPAPECATCGACCREAFDLIEVAARDPFQKKHKHLLVMRDHGRADLVRPGGRCPPLQGDGSEAAPFGCSLYEERPKGCRDFALGGASCLMARRRVGLSI
jgi:hypothetical protein